MDYPEYTNTPMYISHEGLLLNFEQAMTRRIRNSSFCEEPSASTSSSSEDSSEVSRSISQVYDLSSQFIWIGERTSNFDEAHVEFFRGISNPIGLKIGPNREPEHIVKIIKILNPSNEVGKLTLILRLGKKTCEILPELVDLVNSEDLNVLWISDPMHGNTY